MESSRGGGVVDGLVLLRRCADSPADGLRVWLSWLDDATGGIVSLLQDIGGGACFGGRFTGEGAHASSSSSARGKFGAWSRACGNLCFPEYRPSVIENLEESREDLGLALVGQFTVVVFHCLTGHIYSGLTGMLIFVVGNHARCTLRHANLTGFVCLSAASAMFDSVDLLQRVLELGSGFFVLPFEENLYIDLCSLAAILRPVSEVAGVRAAWASFPTPDAIYATPALTAGATERGAAADVARYYATVPDWARPPGGLPGQPQVWYPHAPVPP